MNDKDVNILLNMTGIDIFFRVIILFAKIVNINRFSTLWKIVSYAGLASSTRESSGKIKSGGITKQGFTIRGKMLDTYPITLPTAKRYNIHLRTFYDGIKTR